MNESLGDSRRELKFTLLDKLGELGEANGFVQFVYSKYGPGHAPPPLREFMSAVLHDHATEYMGERLKAADSDLEQGKYREDEKAEIRGAVMEEVEREMAAVEALFKAYAPNADQEPGAD